MISERAIRWGLWWILLIVAAFIMPGSGFLEREPEPEIRRIFVPRRPCGCKEDAEASAE